MSQISVTNLTFCYEGSFDNIFDKVSFSIDTDWKLGFVGRNGKGKTTFLQLLLGKYEYQGSIVASTVFDYFPYQVTKMQMQQCASEWIEEWKAGCEQWRVICEMEKMGLDAEVLYRPFVSLSHGERTKVMLAVLFSGEHEFLLIDEPTNHLDSASRDSVKAYLKGKKGFILVSHDRDLLDACIDHVLVLNRSSIEVQSGNFSSWWENKNRKDTFAKMENEKHLREIRKLKKAAEQTAQWADKNERTKIGFDPIREHERDISTRSYIGAKTKKMQSRVKQMTERMEREIEEKEGLLNDLENPVELKIMPLQYHKEVLVSARDLGLTYYGASHAVFKHLDFEVHCGERVFLTGVNGCGKSSVIKAILEQAWNQSMHAVGHEVQDSPINMLLFDEGNSPVEDSVFLKNGELTVASGLKISYVSQDTSFLKGSIREYCKSMHLEESLFCAILRQLDMSRVQFAKNMEEYSEGQKKKVLIASSLMTPAHLYIWDEPLNYIDVFSRMQIEKLILQYKPTMLVVDHDVRFRERIATKEITFSD